MVKDVPFIAHMLIIDETDYTKAKRLIDNSYYNSELDSDSEYCQNTTAWD